MVFQLLFSMSCKIEVTSHFICPKDIYLESLPLIKNESVMYFWLNWQSLEPFLVNTQGELDEGKIDMFLDLRNLLRRKKLINFAGFQYSNLDFSSNLPNDGFWKEKWWNVALPSVPKNFNFWR